MNSIKKLVIGTPLEGPARRLVTFLRRERKYFSISRKSDWDRRAERDERNTLKLLDRVLKSESNGIDIGAHGGWFLERFLERAPDGKHFAFEPLPKFAAMLKEKFIDVQLFKCALSNHTGTVTFYHARGREAWSGLQKQRYPNDAVAVEIQVEVQRLDDVIPDDILIDFIKIDVEGAELEVFQGAESLLRCCQPVILFEHAAVHHENYETTPEMVYDYLVGVCGLRIWDLGLSKEFSKSEFREIYDLSSASNYDRNAQTNFVACRPDWV